MPHGPVRVGRVELVALCDAVIPSSRPGSGSYPGVREEIWERARTLHPEVFADDGRWRFHVHAFAARSGGRTFVMDTGLGPASGPAFAWSQTAGSLTTELAAAEIDPAEVEFVVISHVHDDHIGGNVTEGGTPAFPNATYVLHRADWDLMANAPDEEDREIFAAVLQPLEHGGVLRLVEGPVDVTDEVRLEPAPGHTPGHQVLAVDSAGERAVIAADLVNHPAQLLQPGLAGASDMDPELASSTRAAWLERAEREGGVVAAAHFPEAFGRIVSVGDERRWRPLVR